MKNLIHWFLNWKQWFLDAIFPPRCIICQKEGFFLCEEHSLPEGGTPSFHPKNLSKIFFATSYTDPQIKKLISHFKFRGNTELGKYFANTISKNIPIELLKNTLIIPIPLHWTRKLWRGFNQAEIIAKHIKDRYPNIEISTNLKRVRRTKQQAKLSRQKRLKNLENAFSWKGATLGKEIRSIVLLDDVVTSGSTLEAAAKVLKKSGAKHIYGVTFAGGGK